ncbi:hypothetical protein AL713_15855 [Clostridium botulinum]|nr:hypothetical protein AL713_15855 [Clostridium botulinum]
MWTVRAVFNRKKHNTIVVFKKLQNDRQSIFDVCFFFFPFCLGETISFLRTLSKAYIYTVTRKSSVQSKIFIAIFNDILGKERDRNDLIYDIYKEIKYKN